MGILEDIDYSKQGILGNVEQARTVVKTLKRNGEDIVPDSLTRQSGLPDDMIEQTDNIPEMLKRQSGL